MSDRVDEVRALFPGAEVIEDVDDPVWPSSSAGLDTVLAELAQAAGAIIDHMRTAEPDRMRRQGWQRLDAAVSAARHTLSKGPVAGPAEVGPAVRSGAHKTEEMAGLDAIPTAQSEARFVLDAIVAAGRRGATLDEIHAAMQAERGAEATPAPNQLQARRWALASRHDPPWVEPKRWEGPGERMVDDAEWGRIATRRTRKGSWASVWVLSAPGARRLQLEE